MGALLTLLPSLLAGGLDMWKEKRQAEHQLELKRIEQGANVGNGLHWFSYCVFAGPVILTMIWPEQGAKVFQNLGQVPDYWREAFVYLTGAVWGVQSINKASGPGGVFEKLAKGLASIKGKKDG